MTLTELQKEVGSLSQPSKMPCHGYSIPAKACNVGSKLREITNSVCSKCYALKNRYAFNNVQSAMNKRLASLSRNVDKWERNLTELINRKEKSGYFRWHDSGDLQSKEHLTAINNIAKSLSHIKFWLPIRLSASIIGTGLISPTVGNYTINTSSVGWDKSKFHCPAPKQGNACGSCRACWDREIPNTNYHLH
jgi:hypothetical protein